MVIVITGSNTLLVQSELKSIVSRYRQKNGDSIEKFDAVEIQNTDEILNAVRGLSLLAESKLVVVRDFGQNKDLLEKLEDILKQKAETTTLVLVDQKVDKRSSEYKNLIKSAELRVFNDVEPYELEKWVIEQAVLLGSKIDKNTAKYLINRVGNNQQLLYQELIKLSIHSDSIINKDIDKLTEPTPQTKIFDMLDALFQGNSPKAWKLYEEQRQQGAEPQMIVSMLTWQLQQLTKAVYAPEPKQKELLDSGMSSYSAQKSIALSKHISRDELKHHISLLASVDAESKTSADVESALEVYFADFVA